jgi:hypothetical protein
MTMITQQMKLQLFALDVTFIEWEFGGSEAMLSINTVWGDSFFIKQTPLLDKLLWCIIHIAFYNFLDWISLYLWTYQFVQTDLQSVLLHKIVFLSIYSPVLLINMHVSSIFPMQLADDCFVHLQMIAISTYIALDYS